MGTEATSGSPALQDVVRSVVDALSEVLNRELPDADAGTRLFEDLGLDSTAVLELLMAVENRLDVEFDPDTFEQEHFASVGSLSTYIREAIS
ncbi:acyl carrier protein [Streptomyces sp. NPDC005538]|uniref:acyl carrier protein n=1 Tax=unclassified Streptomyces TaxID=2593676 RepID=UPI0033A516A1